MCGSLLTVSSNSITSIITQSKECAFVSESTQACAWHRLSFPPSVIMCIHDSTLWICVCRMHQSVSLQCLFKHTHDDLYACVCLPLCVMCRSEKVCFISLLATSKRRTTEFCSVCSSFVSRVARGMDGQAGITKVPARHVGAPYPDTSALFPHPPPFHVYLEEPVCLFHLHEYKGTDFYLKIQFKDSRGLYKKTVMD